jgi:hypothetical protein
LPSAERLLLIACVSFSRSPCSHARTHAAAVRCAAVQNRLLLAPPFGHLSAHERWVGGWVGGMVSCDCLCLGLADPLRAREIYHVQLCLDLAAHSAAVATPQSMFNSVWHVAAKRCGTLWRGRAYGSGPASSNQKGTAGTSVTRAVCDKPAGRSAPTRPSHT